MSAGRDDARGERGQATVEWVGLVLAVALALGALAAQPPHMDGRTFGGFLAYRIACAAGGGCNQTDRALEDAYGERDAALVRRLAPGLLYEPGERQLPVDWRRCRAPSCAGAPDDRSLDAHRTRSGRATVFTRLIRRGGRVYVQYWLYFPDSNTTVANADRLWERSWLLPALRRLVWGNPDWPGYHADDWETVQLRLDPDGSTWVRGGTHGRYQSCASRACRGRWGRSTGWARVSRGSHSIHVPGHVEVDRPPRLTRFPRPRGRRRFPIEPVIPGPGLRERTTTPEGLRLIPLETHDTRAYRPLDPAVKPPWRKEVYADPESDES